MMDSRDCPCGQSRVRDEAAQWFVRLQDPVMSLDERQRFEAWLGEHPNHRDEIQLLQGIWSATDLLPRERLQALCERPAERPRRRPLLRYAVAAGLVAALISTMLGHVWLQGPNNRLQWDGPALKELIAFGRWVLLSSAVGVLAAHGDRIWFGGSMSAAEAGQPPSMTA